jgi:hypothetical protein
MTISSQLESWKAQHPDYVIVFAQDDNSKETRFRADSDDQAMELVQKQFPEMDWTLYRIAGGERWHVYKHQGQAQSHRGEAENNEHRGGKLNPNAQM